MKIETAEKLERCNILASPLKNIGGLVAVLIYLTFIYCFCTEGLLSSEFLKSIPGIIFSSVALIYFIVCPPLFVKQCFGNFYSSMPGLYGSVSAVTLILFIFFFLIYAAVYILGLVLMVLVGVLRPIFTVIAAAVYNKRITGVISLTGDLTPYLENERFLKKLDSISDSIDFFREIGWISKAKNERFTELYEEFAAVLEIKENYEAGNAEAV